MKYEIILCLDEKNMYQLASNTIPVIPRIGERVNTKDSGFIVAMVRYGYSENELRISIQSQRYVDYILKKAREER